MAQTMYKPNFLSEERLSELSSWLSQLELFPGKNKKGNNIVVFTESLCHVKQKQNILFELHRVLKKGGKIVGEDWSTYNHHYTKGIDKDYGTYLDSPKEYNRLFSKFFKNTQIKTFTPIWEMNNMRLITDQAKLLYYKVIYPNLPLSCPYGINENMISKDLLKAGESLQKNKYFRLIIVSAQK